MKLNCFLLASFVLGTEFSVPQLLLAQAKSATAVVPFVGCMSDGQLGPQTAPAGRGRTVAIRAQDAGRLAFYKAEDGFGVLAPRGWHCFSTYGSSGMSLFISPDPIVANLLFSDGWKGFSGAAIQLSVAYGGTSGRFEVAEIAAHVFPAYKAFVERVIAEGIEPASEFPFGPYAKDKLVYHGNSVVEFETPANTEGLGTRSRLQKNASSIGGVAILYGEDTDLIQLSARLPEKDCDLLSSIANQVEYEVAHAKAQ